MVPSYSAGSASVSIGPNLKGFGNKLRAELEKVDAKVPVQVVPNTAGLVPLLQGELKKVRASLPVNVVPNMRGFRTKLRDELKQVDARIPVRANTTAAMAEVARLRKFAGADVSMGVNVDRNAIGQLTRALGGVSQAAGGASSSLGSMSSVGSSGMKSIAKKAAVIVPAIAAVTPVVLGAIGSIGVGLAGLGAAAGPALGAVMLGMDGIKNAAAQITPQFDALKASVSGAFEKALAPAMAQLGELLTKIGPAMSTIATAIGGVGTSIATMLNNSGALQTLLDSVGTFVNAMGPGIQGMVQGFLDFGAAVAPVMDVLGGAFGSVLGSLGQVFSKLANSGVITGVIQGFADALGGLSSFINPLVESMVRLGGIVGPVLGQMFTVLGDVITRLSPVMENIAAVVGPMLVDVFRMLSPVLAVVFEAVAALMSGLAPLIPVFTQVFEILASALIPVFQQLGPMLAILGTTIAGALTDALTILAPIFPQLAEAFVQLMVAITPLIPVIAQMGGVVLMGLARAFVAVAPAVTRIIELLAQIIQKITPFLIPALQFLQKVATFVFTTLAQGISNWVNGTIIPVLNFLGDGFNKVGDVVGWLKDAAVTAWEKISSFISGAGDRIGSTIDAVKGFFQSVSDKAVAVKDWIVGAWDAVVGFVEGMPGRIASAASGMWDGIKDAFRSMMNWLIAKWNNFSITIDLPDIIPGLPDEFTLSTPDLPYFNTGGPVHGPGTGRSDSIPAMLSNGEFVNDAESTRKNRPLLEALNSGWTPPPELLHSMVPGFANGGYVDAMTDVVKARFPQSKMTSGYRAGANDFHGQGKATDWVGPDMGAIAQWIFDTYKGVTNELIHKPFGHNMDQGEDVGNGVSRFGAGTMNGHRDHVHWAVNQPPPPPVTLEPTRIIPDQTPAGPPPTITSPAAVAPVPYSPGASGVSMPTPTGATASMPTPNRPTTISGALSSAATTSVGAFVEGQTKDVLGIFGVPDQTSWGKALSEYDKAVAEKEKQQKAMQQATAPTPQTSGVPNLPTSIPATTPGQRSTSDAMGLANTVQPEHVQVNIAPDVVAGGVKGAVQKAFQPYGWNVGPQWSAADWIIGKESSWNPTARNPSSGAFGLFQFLGSTKDQYLPNESPDPFVQGQAGARYIQDRYGMPTAAKSFWESHHWYADGGYVSGSGTAWSDSIMARLSNGEFVVNASATRANRAELESMNSGGKSKQSWKPGAEIHNHLTVANHKSAVREITASQRRTQMQFGGVM